MICYEGTVAALKSDRHDNSLVKLIIKDQTGDDRLYRLSFVLSALFRPSVTPLKAMSYLIDLQHFVCFFTTGTSRSGRESRAKKRET